VAARRATIITEILARFEGDDRTRLVELLERFIESADRYVAQSVRLELPGRAPDG
jgi:hypothetical protein